MATFLKTYAFIQAVAKRLKAHTYMHTYTYTYAFIQAVAKRLKAFGCIILYTGPRPKPEAGKHVRICAYVGLCVWYVLICTCWHSHVYWPKHEAGNLCMFVGM
jgi:hypothetical protein